jgi:hypothetical protein
MFRQEVQGRNYPFAGISCLYGVWLLANGTFIFDSITIALICIAVWLIVSIIWSETSFSMMELTVILSYFLLFSAARTVPPEIIMWILIPNGVVVSIHYIVAKLRKKKTAADLWAFFGNSNHTANFLITSFFASLWLVFNVSYYLFPISVLLGSVLIMTKVRGAFLGVSAGIITSLCFLKSEMIIYSLVLAVTLILFNRKRFVTGNYLDRFSIFMDAVKKIHPKWITGRGINFFRLQEYGRVHNDHLEIIGEIGIVGYLLFMALFSQLSYNPIMVACVVAFLVHALFFYPFREVHTAAPFWVMLGTIAPVTDSIYPIIILKLVSALAIMFVFLFVFAVYGNLINSKSVFPKKKVIYGDCAKHT